MAEKNDYSQEAHPFISRDEDERLKNESPSSTKETEQQALLDLEKAREAKYPWVEAADKAAAYLKSEIAEAKKKIKQAVNSDLEKYQTEKLKILQKRWQRLETLSSEKRGASDPDLNALAFSKYEEDKGRESAIQYNDEARAELLNELSREITNQEIGIIISKPEEEVKIDESNPEDLALTQKEEEKKPAETEVDEIPNPEDFATKIAAETVKSEEKKEESVPAAVEVSPASVPMPEAEPEIIGAERPRKRIALVKAEKAVEEAAQHMAEARLTRKSTLRKEKGWRKLKNIPRFAKAMALGLWDYTFDAARRQHHYKKAKKEIESSKSLYIGEGDINRRAHLAGMQALVDRFASGYEELVHKEAGEESEIVQDEEFNREIKSLIKDYAVGGMSRDEFDQKRNTIIASRMEGKISEKEITDGLTYADNLFEIAEQARQSVEHGAGLEKLDLDFEIVAGKAKMGCRTEMQLSKTERIIDKIQNNKAGKFLFHETIIVPLAYCLGRKAVQIVTMSKIVQAATLLGSAGAGAALTKKRLDIMQEKKRAQDMYEAASGKTEFDRENSPQRLELEAIRYKTKSAAELSRELETNLYASRGAKENKLKNVAPEQFQAAYDALAEIEARIRLSDQHKIDLISYSNPKRVEQERRELDLLRAEAKLDLSKLKQEKGLSYDYANVVQMQENALTKERTEKDNQFQKIKRAKSLKGAAVSGGVGLVLGATAQEVMATLPDWHVSLAGHEISFGGGRQSGLLESALKHGKPEGEKLTALAALVEHIRGGNIGGKGEMISQAVTMQNGQEMQVQLPKGFSLADPDHNGQFDLMEGDKLWGRDAVTIAPDGKVTFSDALEKQGFTSHTNFVESVDAGKGASAGAEQLPVKQDINTFLESDWAKKNAVSIHHEDWFRNRKPDIPDLNEIKLQEGGTSEHPCLYTDENGKEWIEYSVQRMTPDGSFSSRFSVDAQALMKSGKMKFFLYPSAGHQAQAFELPVPVGGKIHIDPEGELGEVLWRRDAKGFDFMGRYGEIEYILGEKNGVKQIIPLATMEGPGMPEMPSVGGPMPIPIIERPPQDWELFPPIPMKGEKALEPMWLPEKQGMIYYGHYGFAGEKEYEQRKSPRLSNPEAELDEKEELDWYFGQQPSEYLEELESLDQQINEPMNENCRLVIAIPSYKEEKNIYHTLEQYACQKDKEGKAIKPETFEIIILDNHPEGGQRDKTQEEVARFKKDHPELKVRYVYKEFPKEEASMGNIRKHLNDLALSRSRKRSKQAGDLILVSNDADLEGLSSQYLDVIKNDFDKNEKIDAITGKLDYPKEAYEKLPIIHASRRLWQYFDIIMRHKYLKTPELMGGNSAMRAGTYAALGGYNPRSGLGEDLEMGWMLKRARGDYAPEHMKYENKAMLITDPRRAILTYVEGKPHIKQHEDFIQNHQVRDLTWEQLLPKDREKFEEEVFEKEADALYQFYSNVSWMPKTEFEEYFKRAMGFLGAKYRIEGGHIKVEDVRKLEKGLNEFKKEIGG